MGLDFAAPTALLAFDQGAKVYMPISYKSGTTLVDLTGYGARMALRGGDANAILITPTITLPAYPADPNIIVTIPATASQGIVALNGTWALYLDPNGTEDADSFCLMRGSWSCAPQVPL